MRLLRLVIPSHLRHFEEKFVFSCRTRLTNCICTSGVVKCDKSIKSQESSDISKEKEKQQLESKAVKSNKGKKKTFASGRNERLEAGRNKFRKESNKKGEISTASAAVDPSVAKLFGKSLASAVDNVAEHFGGNRKQTKEDLLSYLQKFRVSKGEKKEDYFSDAEAVMCDGSLQSIFGGVNKLNIFKQKNFGTEVEQLKLNIWNDLEEEELKSSGTVAPRNHFEELINWTNEGRLWHFPIDNDQGLDEEAKVSFTEHIFLDHHLEPWCPKKGPLRKFMELVLVGLAKNPHFSVEEKKEHIAWFQNYFEDKKKLLKELGAMGEVKEINALPQEKS